MSDAVNNPPAGMPRITAGVYYEDSASGLTFLEKAFGFKTRLKIPGPNGQIMHSELEYEDGLIFVGQACPDEKRPARKPSTARRPPACTFTWMTSMPTANTPVQQGRPS